MSASKTVSDRIDVLADIVVRKFDPADQPGILVEEMSELTQVLSKMQRGKAVRDKLNEEFSHVLSSCEVVRRVLEINDADVLEQVERKIQEYAQDDQATAQADCPDQPQGSPEVMAFIDAIYASQPEQNAEAIRALFHNGYCYYFANMLRQAFGRGTVCLAYPFGHIVWLDDDGVAYDIEGVSCSEYEKLVDIDCLPELKYSFMHVPGLESPPDIRKRVDDLLADHPAYVKWPPSETAAGEGQR